VGSKTALTLQMYHPRTPKQEPRYTNKWRQPSQHNGLHINYRIIHDRTRHTAFVQEERQVDY
jgi:hypothetical protein